MYAVRASAVQGSAVSTGRSLLTNTLEKRPGNTVQNQFLAQIENARQPGGLTLKMEKTNGTGETRAVSLLYYIYACSTTDYAQRRGSLFNLQVTETTDSK